MGNIDRQRIAAVKTLEALCYTFDGNMWMPPAGRARWPEADALYFALLKRADDLVGCVAGSVDERELNSIFSLLQTYEDKRWPNGREPGGKG
jgi:hypothetical protein